MSRTSNKYLQRLPMGMGMVMIFFFYFIEITYEQRPPPYIPVENIIIDCGSSGEHIAKDKRSWNGDIDSKFFPLEGQNKASAPLKAVERTIALDPVPYETARLSLSEFTYTVPVTPGPKFVRLYFFSATYRDFNRSKAFFEVRIDKYTLLKNFSASLTADALNIDGIEKEYILTVEKSPMKITFTPTSSQAGGAFAFINGIEIVSMPSALYYSNGRGLAIVGQEGRFFTLTNNTAMETMYRINIGGNTLSPIDDTGMFRQWNTEEEYLVSEGLSVLPVAHNTTTPLKFRDNISSYAAPDSVYKTGRSTGNKPNKTLLRSYNLTWEFSVDSKFRYMLRLHFCEINKEFTEVGDRVFYIYIADDRVEKKFDIINFAHGQYVPYYKDYLWFGNNSDQKKVKLSVALQANPDDYRTTFVDAILNGLEIFKLNDDSSNLAGLNPDPTNRTAIARPSTDAEKGKSSLITIIGVVLGVAAAIVMLSVLGFFIIRRGKKVKDAASTSEKTSWWGPISFSTTRSSKTRTSSSLPSDLCRYFSLAEIKAATNNFEDIFIIGVGGFGNVYKGYVDNGTVPVAIKRLKPESSQGFNEFKTEIEMLTHLRHRHLVSLIGYCNDEREMILVYDYMAQGTLRSHLYNTENLPLGWRQRLEICIGAARGLHYLHTGSKYTIIHRDVKTTNILLDEKWVAKVSDFGLSKTGPTSMSKAHITTVVKGSIGYLDPEYYKRQQLTEKSDVYSFGVVLFEVLCGRPPIVRTAEKRQVSLAEWARCCYQKGTLHQIIDPHLTGRIAPECLKKYGDIAVSCMLDNGTERPSMNDVVWGLEFAMQLQKNAEDNDSVGGALIKMKGEDEVALINSNSNSDWAYNNCSSEDGTESKSSGVSKLLNISSEEDSTTKESMKGLSGTVFSEINDPKGR
ncbi:receptor-like protein kinase FERONIA [Humulus lupulus]|uniref:receptor-like protein kinase FERONIA n=1 Tax=Humulus lupulus TaxID=3486 RepID=UPI002B410288|nr:receptor-like protein kinase FERONIA [Humulus lupulus]